MLAYHCIFGTYGFWLPNDPRGSGSDYVAAWELYRFGQATKVNTSRSVARRPVPPAWKTVARNALRWLAVTLDGRQALAVGQGFAIASAAGGYRLHACAILPQHVHLVIGSHSRNVRQVIGHLKSQATRQLRQSNSGFIGGQPVWGAHGWNVYLDTLDDVQGAIRYVESNPAKEGKRPQRWSFVTPFDPAVSRVAGDVLN